MHWKYIAAIITFASVLPSTFAAEVIVTIKNFQFDPKSITVQIGDTVRWNNADNTDHTSTSDDNNLWDSGTLAQGASFTTTFGEQGIFNYHCNFHSTMKGDVRVVAV
ncbi:hypothetical protein BGX28_001765 [Mortierella sp. GBA30]|nr:hypothetical protein BGX28_001765 [Mortierella sp. GBA30]